MVNDGLQKDLQEQLLQEDSLRDHITELEAKAERDSRSRDAARDQMNAELRKVQIEMSTCQKCNRLEDDLIHLQVRLWDG